MCCCCLRTVDLMLLWTELLCLLFSSGQGDFSCGETLFSQHSWTITSFPGSLSFQWVSWVTDDVMATRKKEVSKRHMREKWRVGCVCVCMGLSRHKGLVNYVLTIWFSWDAVDGLFLHHLCCVGKSCELVFICHIFYSALVLSFLCLCSLCSLSEDSLPFRSSWIIWG